MKPVCRPPELEWILLESALLSAQRRPGLQADILLHRTWAAGLIGMCVPALPVVCILRRIHRLMQPPNKLLPPRRRCGLASPLRRSCTWKTLDAVKDKKSQELDLACRCLAATVPLA